MVCSPATTSVTEPGTSPTTDPSPRSPGKGPATSSASCSWARPTRARPTRSSTCVQGREFGPRCLWYPPAVLGTFPSIYQLLPRGRHGPLVDSAGERIEDLFDPALWERSGWGLASEAHAADVAMLLPGETGDDAREVARAFLRRVLRRADAFTRALDRPASPPDGLDLFLVAGDAIPTLQQVRLDEDGSLEPVAWSPGDGTVLRTSALADERAGGPWRPRMDGPIGFRSVLFLPEEHLASRASPVFSDNVLYWLLEEPRAAAR